MDKLVKSFSVNFLVLFALLLALSTGAEAKDKLKIGSKKLKVQTEGLNTSTQVGNDFSISMAGTKGFSVGSVNLIFSNIADQIVEGAEFDLAPSSEGVDGQVSMTVSISTTKRSGKTKAQAADEGSTTSGKVKITKVNTDGSFTAKFKAKVKNALEIKTNPLKGDFEGKEKRSKKALKVSGQVTTNLEAN